MASDLGQSHPKFPALPAQLGALEAVAAATGQRPVSLAPLSGGCVGDVRLATLVDGGRVVIKLDPSAQAGLEVEARSLATLTSLGSLPTPRVLAAGPTALVMEFIDASSALSPAAETHAAELLARLHEAAPAGNQRMFGLDFDARLGGLTQPNAWLDDWPEFFAHQRVLAFAKLAHDAGALPIQLFRRVESLARAMRELVDNPPAASLVHGDVWSGNVLCNAGKIAAFLDPAPYFAHAEVELAFITLFSTFGQTFFDAYSERRPIEPGFFKMRRHVYNVYPLLAHVRLFGGGYVGQLDTTLRTIGF